jgi:GDP-L-fucose synthase
VLPALLRKIHLGKCLEENNWEAITKDLDRNPIELIDGSSDHDAIIKILDKYGVRLISDTSQRKELKQKVSVKIWGTGNPKREFMYSLDMAEACVYVMETADISDILQLYQPLNRMDYHPPHFINIGTGEEVSIKELALRIKELIGFKGEIVFDSSIPDGTMRKITDVSALKKLGFRHKFNLDNGLKDAYANYLNRNN